MSAEGDGFIYFVCTGNGGPVKIGWSLHPERRLAMLQVGNPERLKLLGAVAGTREDERRIHDALAPEHILGEWFFPGTSDPQALVERLRERLAAL